jgi:hypothetical protein
MDRIPVKSEKLESIGYDPFSETLELEFAPGDVYRYGKVPKHIFTNLLLAESKISFFHVYIKENYPIIL